MVHLPAHRCRSRFSTEKVSRGTTFGDYDDDGDIDLLVVELNDDPTLLRNDGGNANSWLSYQGHRHR